MMEPADLEVLKLFTPLQIKNDQLTRLERVRLEALAQANAYAQMKNITPNEIIEIARIFEKFLLEADIDKIQ